MAMKSLKQLDVIDQASVPIFIVTMLAEAAVLKRRSKRGGATRVLGDLDGADLQTLSGLQRPPDPLVPLGYERKDTTASLAMLVGSVAATFATAAVLERLDGAMFKRRISNVGSRKHSLLAALVLWDLLYYWNHRLMHEVRVLWANHVSHHSSERYNLSTALRQPWSSLTMAWVFAPMPLLGFPARVTMRAGQLNLLYQYWIHTEAIDRLPKPIETVFNTPSHHRAHHGANQQYLDKNYGGILIVWDRLFGTFEPEVRRLKYGLTKNISTYNPLRIAYHEYASIVRDVASARGLRHKLGHVFGRPGWTPIKPAVGSFRTGAEIASSAAG
jgi:sterol desaturase/sphingolipid hydroxylase (fatty acid hydroxylase superfamily)